MLKIQMEKNSGNFNHDDLIEKLTYDYTPFTYFDEELKTELSEIIELLETNQNTIEPIITFQNNMHQTQNRLNLNESFEEIVKKLAATLEANYNISTKVYIGSTKIQHLSENVQIELIRILQEALSNISRHANASNVEIRFVDGIDDFRFIIKDDGKGFSEEEVELKNKQSAKKHYGVSNIKERVELLGGTVNFISEGGTTIAITIKDSVR